MTERRTPEQPDDIVDIDGGVRLATWTTLNPEGEGLPVVLVHGGPGLWDYLGGLADLLDTAAAVHRYDQRGCGRSTGGHEQSMANSVADLEALRRHWGHERWVVVGHSFGADLALAYAAAHPGRVASMAYLSGVGTGDWHTPYRAARTAALTRLGPHAAARLSSLAGLPARGWPDEVEYRTLAWATDYADPVAGVELARPMAETDLPIRVDVNRALSGTTDADKVGWAAAAQCPVFIIHGSADIRPAANALQLAAKLHRPRKRVVQGGGHLPWVEQPDEVAELLAEVVAAGTAQP